MKIIFTILFFALLSIGLTAQEKGKYPIVETGQATFYNNLDPISEPGPGDSFYGQDANFTGAEPAYQDNGDGTVSDLVTGLMWQKKLLDEKLNFADAKNAADTFSLAGYDDWRLPTIKELYSLIMFYGKDPSGWEGSDVSQLTPFINTEYFDFRYGNVEDGDRIIDAQWASATEYGDGQLMFGVNFADGRIKGYPKEGHPLDPEPKKYEVFFVRGNTEYGKNLFIDNQDGTISDEATGLMWAKDDSKEALNWEAALAWAQKNNDEEYLGYNDWRLPNVKELHSITDYSRSPETTSSPAIDPVFNSTSIQNAEGATDYPYIWSSTTHANMLKGSSASYVSFGRALGWMQIQGESDYSLVDVHGAGAQRSDPKEGNPNDYPHGRGPQGDVIRIYNYARLVRNINSENKVEDNNLEDNGDVMIYPNPASDRITFNFDKIYESHELTIINHLGIEYLVQDINTKSSIDIKEWPAGVYVAIIRDNLGIIRTEKFIKR